MFQIIGIVLLFALVFGSFIISGGNLGVILHAMPHEMMAIGGAGVASFLIANSMTVIKGAGGGLGKVFKGPKWKPSDYRDLLSLLFLLTKTMKSTAKWSFITVGKRVKIVLSVGFSMWLSRAITPFDFMVLVSRKSRLSRSR